MRRLIYFEMRKNFLKKNIFLVVLCVVLINILNWEWSFYYGMENETSLLTPYNVSSSCYQYYKEMHEKFDGYITIGKVKEINNRYEELYAEIEDGTYSREFSKDTATGYIFGDYYFFGNYIYSSMRYAATYAEEMGEKVKEIEDNIKFYEKVGNEYDTEKNKYLKQVYSNRKITSFYENTDWEYLFHYQFSDLLSLFVILLGVIPIYCNEKSNGMYFVLLSNREGRKNYYIGKFIAILIFVSFITILFGIINFFMADMLFSLQGGEQPLYSIQKYQYTPLNCSLLSFYIQLVGMKLLGYVVIAYLMGFISQKAKGIVSSYLGSVGIIIAGLFLSGFYQSEFSLFSFLSVLSPFTMLKGNGLYGQFLELNFAGIFLERGTACIIFQLFLLAGLFSICIIKTCKLRLKRTIKSEV